MNKKEDVLPILKSPLVAILLVASLICIYSYIAIYPRTSIPFVRHVKLIFQDEYFKARLFYNDRFRTNYPRESVVTLVAIDNESTLKN